MTRKEKIQQSALELYPPIYSSSRERDAYIQGAEWADKHPREGLVDIEKVVEWLEAHNPFINEALVNDWVDNFRKKMTELTLEDGLVEVE